MIDIVKRWAVWTCLDDGRAIGPRLAGRTATERRQLDRALAESAASRAALVEPGLVPVDAWCSVRASGADPPAGERRFPWAAQIALAGLAIVIAWVASVPGVGSTDVLPAAGPVPGHIVAAGSLADRLAKAEARADALASSIPIGRSPLAREARSLVRDAGEVLQRVHRRLPKRPRPTTSKRIE